MVAVESTRPAADRLYETAAAQQGMFTTEQAAAAGYSPQLILHHLARGRFVRIRRGTYRLVHFPAGEHEDLVATWLWSAQVGIFSHVTALALHQLSDALPSGKQLTVPATWARRRLRIPDDVVLHYADVSKRDRAWFGSVPVTPVRRTLNDCAREGLAPDLLRQAVKQALRRGLVRRADLADVKSAMKPFGGLPA